MSQLSSWDTSLLIVVARAEEWCREHKVKFLARIASTKCRKFGRPFRRGPGAGKPDEETKNLRPSSHILGNKTIAAIEGVGSTLEFTGETVLSFGRILRRKGSLRLATVLAHHAGVQCSGVTDRRDDQFPHWTHLCLRWRRSTSTVWSRYLRRQSGRGRHGSRNGRNYDRDHHGRPHWSGIRGPDRQHEGLRRDRCAPNAGDLADGLSWSARDCWPFLS